MSKLFKNEIFHNEDATLKIACKTIHKYESILDELNEINENGFTFRAGKCIDGKKLTKLVEKLNIEKELLEGILKVAEEHKI